MIFGDTTNSNNLAAYNGTDFVLVGFQAGPALHKCKVKLLEILVQSRSVIVQAVNDEVIFIITVEFTIDSADAENALPGF